MNVWDSLPWTCIHSLFLPCTQNYLNRSWIPCQLEQDKMVIEHTFYRAFTSETGEEKLEQLEQKRSSISSWCCKTDEIRHEKKGAATLTSGRDISLGAGQCWIWPKLQQSCCSSWWLSVYFYTQVHDSLTAWPGNWTSRAGFSNSQAAAVQIFLEVFCMNMLPHAVFLTMLQPRCTPPNADILQIRNWDKLRINFTSRHRSKQQVCKSQ